MQAIQVTHPSMVVDGVPHHALIRNEPRMLIEVDVIPQNGTNVGGQRAPFGKSKVVIYASEFDAVKAKVVSEENAQRYALARQQDEEMFVEWVRSEFGAGMLVRGPDDTWTVKPEERERMRRMYPSSPEALLHAFPSIRRAGGVGALRSVRKIKDVPAPSTPETGADRLGESIVRAVQAVAGGGKAKASAD